MRWVLGAIAGLIAAGLAVWLRSASSRRHRAPWLALLAKDAVDAASRQDVGTLAGIAAADAAAYALRAPITQRACLGFCTEIIVRSYFLGKTTWRLVHTDGAGTFSVGAPDGRIFGRIDLAGAERFLPPESLLSRIGAETVHARGLDDMPPAVYAFFSSLPPDVQAEMRGGANERIEKIFVNERLVLPGQSVVACGPCTTVAGRVHVRATESCPIYLGYGTRADEEARARAVPIADHAFLVGTAAVVAFSVAQIAWISSH